VVGGRDLIECIELEHSERQELMRDMQNRIVREDVDTLESYVVFKREKIVKIMATESEGVIRLWVLSDAG
jgi:hypothetical protein